MSKLELKKELKTLSKDKIIDIVLELYSARKEAKEYLEFFLNPNEKSEVEKYKMIILDEFCPSKGEPKCRFSVCRKAISDFKKLKPSPEVLADLMLYYIEEGVQVTIQYGDMWEQYYTALENNFEKAVVFIAKNGLMEQYKVRIEVLLESVSHCGWGFYDTLGDIYEANTR